MGNRGDKRGQEQALLGIMDGKEIPYSRHGQERLVILLLSPDSPQGPEQGPVGLASLLGGMGRHWVGRWSASNPIE